MATRRQIAANRINAQKSTGPATPEGRAAVRYNALRHGLTAHDAALSIEEESEFQETLDAFIEEHDPRTPLESVLVQQIVTAAWRLRRARVIETGFIEMSLLDLEEEIQDEVEHPNAQVRLGYVVSRDSRGPDTLGSLSYREARIERSFYRALNELERAQARRAGHHVPLPVALDVMISDDRETIEN
ncbi:MAG: hypothetical protein ABIZ80_17230 [Bryobacteraceae bacterium]